MDRPIETFMRLGIVHAMAFPELATGDDGPWEETVRHIALDPFFKAIEITHIEAPQVRDHVRDLTRLARLSVVYGAHPHILGQGLNINSLDNEERTRACTLLKKDLGEAIHMGAESFGILSGKDPGAENRVEAVKALIASLKDLCAYSAGKGGPRILITRQLPHIGNASIETKTKMGLVAGQNLIAALRGEIPPNCLNPEIYE